jgi:pimeloyl-ACP methyl ester carboxylesterase
MDEKYITVNGYKTRYLESGNSDKNLVLLHGLGGSADSIGSSIHITPRMR